VPILRAASGFQVSRPVMEKVPYALKIETPESCLTLSARYEERKDRGSVGQDFARGKVWNRRRRMCCQFYFGVLFG